MPDSPTSQKPKRSGLLSGAKAYLGVSSRSKQSSSELSRTLSEPVLHAPVTPKTPREKIKVSSREKNRTPAKASSRYDESPGNEGSHSRLSSIEMSPDPQTPRAKQKIRRVSSTVTGSSPRETSRGQAVSVSDSDFAVSPSISKPRRRAASAGPLDDVAKERGRKVREESREKKKTRHASSGPLERRSKRSSKTPTTVKHGSLRQLNDHLGDLELPLERNPPEGSDSPKLRTTVDGEGRISRVKKSNGNVSDDEDGKSKYSTSSKRSKVSTKSTKSKKSVSKTKEKVDGKEKTKSTSGDPRRSSDGSEKSSRSTRKVDTSEASERRAGKRSILLEDKSDRNLRSSLESLDTENRRSTSGRSVGSSGHRKERGSISNDDGFMSIAEAKSDANGDDEVARLNKKVIELSQEILKIQFAAQSEAAKMKKELREEKLELQRCQTERRELRTQLRERDILVDESDRRIKALEKAVESQLDKVDDLEEELRRANEEIFDLEGKLGGMEQVLAESSAIETTALQKEKDFREKREERMERRLEEREKELEERERKLRDERDAMVHNGDSQRNVEQLEQDNRMLLKTLNRERAEAMDKLNEKDEEVKRLQKELKLAKMRSYSRVGDATSNESITKLVEDNAVLQRRLDEETDQLNTALKIKDERIASLEEQLKLIISSGNVNGSGGDKVLLTEIESLKADLLVMRSKWEGAQRRNQLLEEDVDHWKSVNCGLEDELADWKSQVANWRSKYEDMLDAEGGNDIETHVSEPITMIPYMTRNQSAAQLALGRRDYEEDNKSTVSEPATSIANLWSKLTTPTAKRNSVTMNSESVREVLARTTFH